MFSTVLPIEERQWIHFPGILEFPRAHTTLNTLALRLEERQSQKSGTIPLSTLAPATDVCPERVLASNRTN